MEKSWFYERFFFEVVMVKVKMSWYKYSVKDKMSIKICFLHYVKWTRVMLPVAFEEIEVACIFLAIFFFSL